MKLSVVGVIVSVYWYCCCFQSCICREQSLLVPTWIQPFVCLPKGGGKGQGSLCGLPLDLVPLDSGCIPDELSSFPVPPLFLSFCLLSPFPFSLSATFICSSLSSNPVSFLSIYCSVLPLFFLSFFIRSLFLSLPASTINRDKQQYNISQ